MSILPNLPKQVIGGVDGKPIGKTFRKPKEREPKAKKKRDPIAKFKNQVLHRDNYTCQDCGITRGEGAVLEIDHIIPDKLGGRACVENLQTLCRDCNNGKRASRRTRALMKAAKIGPPPPKPDPNTPEKRAWREAKDMELRKRLKKTSRKR